ncbi:MAG TPA: helix-turn-helix transcriptional regulator [Candidatus Omnitrophota bacterium]|nr:helix-turn-helix transcriptional regulator [Candidatus Omnitrophota bacterium]
MKNKHVGSSFDDFLKEEDLLEKAQAAAAKKVISFQIRKIMNEKHISKQELSRKMETSRSQLDRLLEPSNESITLLTLERLANALGKKLKIQLV